MDDTTLDAIEGQARFSALTGDGVAPARSVIALVAEVRRLTEEAATQREWFEAADAAAERRLDQSIAWMERAESAEAEVVTLRAKVAAVEARVVEWESDRDVCLAWIADPAMHADEGHPDRLSRVADSLDRHARAMRAALATTGEGQHVAREVFTADGIPFVSCLCTNAKSPTRWLTDWLIRYDPDDGEPYGEICDCEIGDDHDATGEGE